jgi:hypothetical protein
LALAIVGILFILFGSVFALQGDGMIGGSAMTGNPFWIYAGAGIAAVGLIMAALGFSFGSRQNKKEPTVSTENAAQSNGTDKQGSPAQL